MEIIEIMEKVGFIVLGLMLGFIIYIIKRYIEDRGAHEALDKQKKLLDIHKQMNEQELDTVLLKDFENILLGKSKVITAKVIELQQEAQSHFESSDTPEFSTQADMNQYAMQSCESAEIRMQEVIDDIDSRIEDYERQALIMNSQEEWARYSKSQAESAASICTGGTIYPVLYYGELKSLVNERTARLQAELGWHND